MRLYFILGILVAVYLFIFGLGIFKNVSGPQWILTNDKQIKLIDFEKWELNE